VGVNCSGQASGQLCEIEQRFAGKMIDALFVSIGGNDVGFAPTVLHCLIAPNCAGVPVVIAGASTDVNAGKDTLRRRYQNLANTVDRINRGGSVFIANVFMLEYPSPVTDEHNNLCNPGAYPLYDAPRNMPSTKPTLDVLDNISGVESNWSQNTLIPALSEMLNEGAQKFVDANGNGFGFFVGGVSNRFRRHGFCSSSRWINLMRDSLDRQGDGSGVVHPNLQGHEAYAEVLVPELERIISPATPGFNIQSAGSQNTAIIPNGLRLAWSSNSARVRRYEVAMRTAQLGGVLQPLRSPALKWPDSFGVPPRHLGTDDPGWVLNSQVLNTFQTRVVQWPTAPTDYLVRACNEAMCSRWSDPVRVVIIDGFAAKPPPANLTASKMGTSVRVNWTAKPPAANTFIEIELKRSNGVTRTKEVPAGESEAIFWKLPRAQYTATVRECTWAFATPAARSGPKCSVWSAPASVITLATRADRLAPKGTIRQIPKRLIRK